MEGRQQGKEQMLVKLPCAPGNRLEVRCRLPDVEAMAIAMLP
jgi:hypothetical protein